MSKIKIEWKQFRNLLTPKSKVNMKNAKLSAILGREVAVGEVLNADDTAKVEAHLASLDTAASTENPATDAPAATETEKPEANADMASLVSKAVSEALPTALQNALAPISQQLTDVSARLEVVEGKPGASATQNPVVTGTQEKINPWEDPNDPVNKKIAADLGE